MPPTTDDLEAADDEVWSALRHADADALEALSDPEATIAIEPLGLGDLLALTRALRTGALRLSVVELERRRLRITGELATSVTIANVAGTHHADEVRARLRWVRTWRLADDWVLVAQSVGVPDPRRPAG